MEVGAHGKGLAVARQPVGLRRACQECRGAEMGLESAIVGDAVVDWRLLVMVAVLVVVIVAVSALLEEGRGSKSHD